MKKKRARYLIGGAGFLFSVMWLLGTRADLGRPVSITWVSADRLELEGETGDEAVIRYRLSGPATVTVRFYDPFDEPIRTFSQVVEEPGDQILVWDGRDDGGRPVEPEVYVYTITATADGDSSSVVYDLRRRTGGEPVRPHSIEWNPTSGRLRYVLTKPSRVRVILSQRGTGWPVRTLIDWEPRAAGENEEMWDGWDADGVVDAKGMAELEPVFYAFSLPENVLIVKGEKRQGVGIPSPDVSSKKLAHRLEPGESGAHQHALHPRARCYNPGVELSFPEAETINGSFQLRERTPLRIDISPEQPQGRVAPIPRAGIFIFVDGALVERNLDGYIPYHWVLDPAELGPGEHVVSGLLAWRDDHFGMRHIKVNVE